MKKIYIETYGCSRNQADSEIMAGLLSREYALVNNAEDADVVIINTCTIKTPTENKVLKKLKEFEKTKKPIIVAGCMPEVQLDELKKIAPNASFLGPHHVKDVLKVMKKGKNFIGKRKENVLCMPRIRKNKLIGIIPIASGCTSWCSYCVVKYTRGRLFSYPEEKIIEEIKNSLNNGCKELWVTSQDNGAYGFDVKDRGVLTVANSSKNSLDSNTTLPELLEDICKIEGDFWIRVGMMNPQNVLKILDPLVEIYQNDKIFKFLHLPVQSGNNEILDKMNRRYSVEEFEKIVNKFRDKIPDLTLSTDVIVGFPDESEEQFKDSLKLVERIEPDIVNISRFGARPGTKAASMKQIPDWVKKERSRELTKLIEKIKLKKNEKWASWEGITLVDERGRGNSFIGRNFAYKPIVIKSKENLFGEKVNVKIKETRENYLIGSVS